MQWGNTLASLPAVFSKAGSHQRLDSPNWWVFSKATCLYGERRKRLTKKGATCKSENFPIPLRVHYLCLMISPVLVSSVSPIEVL